MITILVAAASFLLFSISLFQTIYVSIYLAKTRLPKSPAIENQADYAPPAAIVLCLRGEDPILIRCLAGIANQSYPDFQLFCVFDHPHDPAVAIVNENAHRFATEPTTIIVDSIPTHRSLKCNSLLHGVAAIDSKYEVIAFIDSDTVPDRRWLSDLVSPLKNREIGVTTGNRWFAPSSHRLGCLLRQTWNAAAVVQMLIYRVAWGGSWAARRETLLNSRLRQYLETAFCEDTVLNTAFSGKTVHRVPHLVVVSDEVPDVRGSFSFIVRQLLNLRLYHRAWPLVLTHGLSVIIANAVSLVAIFLSILAADWSLTILLGCFVFVFQVVNILLLIVIEQRNRQILAFRNAPVRSAAKSFPLPFSLSVIACQAAHPLAIIKAWLAKRVTWRGIEYRFTRNSKVRMVMYRPYESLDNKAAEKLTRVSAGD